MAKRFSILLLGVLGLLFTFTAFGQTAVTPPTPDDWAALMTSLHGLKGAGTLAIVGVCVQFLLLVARGPFGQFAGKYRAVTVTVLTLVGAVLGLKLQGMAWSVVVAHAVALASFQTLVHQIWTALMSNPNATKVVTAVTQPAAQPAQPTNTQPPAAS